MHGGSVNAFKPAILEEGMKYNPAGIPPRDAQFVESAQFSVEQLSRLFRMPLHKIQHLLRATFSNIEEQNLEYVQDTLEAWAKRWEGEIVRQLFDEREKDTKVEFNLKSLTKGNSNDQADRHSKDFQNGFVTQNEVREDMGIG